MIASSFLKTITILLVVTCAIGRRCLAKVGTYKIFVSNKSSFVFDLRRTKPQPIA